MLRRTRRLYRSRRRLLAGVLAAVAMVFGWWLVMLSPFLYDPPGGPVAIDADRAHAVFAYGTLRSPLLRWAVTGGAGQARAAVLPGYRREGLNVRPVVDERVEGVVFEVDARALRRLDRYERLGVRYERVERELLDGTRAWVYRRL